MGKVDQELVQYLLVEYGPEEIQRSYPQLDTCILSTAVSIDVLDYFGIRGRPLSVAVVAGNEAYYKQFKTGSFAGITDSWWDETGAHSVGIGFIADPLSGKHPTYLITITPKFLIDLAIGQVDRPEHGITAKPLLFPTGDIDLFHGDHYIVAKDTLNNSVLIYTPKSHDLTFITFPDWVNKKKRHDIVGRIIKRIKKDL